MYLQNSLVKDLQVDYRGGPYRRLDDQGLP